MSTRRRRNRIRESRREERDDQNYISTPMKILDNLPVESVFFYFGERKSRRGRSGIRECIYDTLPYSTSPATKIFATKMKKGSHLRPLLQ